MKAVSLPKARNKFKPDEPNFACNVSKLDSEDKDKEVVKSPQAPKVTKDGIPGYFFTQQCDEEIKLSIEEDIYSLEGPLQPFSGRSFFDCRKTVSVPEGFHLVAKCSPFRLSQAPLGSNCNAFYQVNDGAK